MERKIDLLLGAAALLVLGFLAAVYSDDLPLGVAGEWKWPRIRAWPSPASLMLASAGLLAYGGFAAAGYRALGGASHTPVGGLRESSWVAGLVACAVAVQVGLAIGAPEGYGLTRWGVVHCFREATGYYDVAREHADDPWEFLADYPTWIEAQGPGHLGTHPPGLIALYSVLLSLMERHESVADRLVAAAPASIERGLLDVEFRQETTIPTPDRATLLLASLLTLFASAGTVAPLYLLARESLSPRAAWASAAFWPLAPALNLFQPLSDAAYPLLSATALATAAWAARWRATPGASAWPAAGAIASGLVMAFGMMFTLALLPIGVMVALVVLTTRALAWPRRVALIAWIGAGFVVGVATAWMATGADPLVVWWWNLRNNASFYEGGRRSYLTWLLVNPIELAIAAGLPAVVWGLALAIGERHAVPRAAWCGLAVVLIADLSGRNLGEVARLWMLFLPPLFTAAGAGVARFGGGGQAIFVTVLLMGIQTLGLQCLTQVVYPP